MSQESQDAPEVPSGPHVQIAALCESVLQETNGILSLIRVVDRITINATPGAPMSMPRASIALKAVIALKADTARGRALVGLRPQRPSGINLDAIYSPVLFEGEDRGVNVIIDLRMDVDEEGLYWFDVFIEDRVITRMPLRIVYAPTAILTPQ